jgi:succinyl-CoA synthetase beta subunit
MLRRRPARSQASKIQPLNYIKLDGNVGCMVNGAGLAMATHGHHQIRRRLNAANAPDAAAAAPQRRQVTHGLKFLLAIRM